MRAEDDGATGEPLLRTLAPEVLAIVARRFGDFARAEDAVQEALIAAAIQWPERGRPDAPRAWLVRVASRRMMDAIRADAARQRREVAVAPTEAWTVDEPSHDDPLLLLFMCCHPALTRPSAIALTLRAVGGLTTAEIAHAFLVPESTMAQRISRAKATIAKEGARFEMPDLDARAARLATVLNVLYLIFNEGYVSSQGASLQRADLSREAIRAMRQVARALPEDPEVAGLLALMLLTDARRVARTGPSGELVPLDQQDRSRWDRRSIQEGIRILTEALGRGAVGSYQVQAAIAAVHSEALDFEDTDWPQILALYGLLAHMSDNPMVTLNRAVALAMVRGAEAGLALLESLDEDPRVREHHRLAAVRGHLLERAGRHAEAIAQYRLAAERTASQVEQEYLVLQAGRLRAREEDPNEG